MSRIFGDHVELSEPPRIPGGGGYPDSLRGMDFASTIGVGGVIGTNFTWPVSSANKPNPRGDLTPEKESHFAKRMKIYKGKMLSQGEYLGSLYDVGFDKPETHAIRRGRNVFYALFAPERKGTIELRGLEDRAYRITAYENNRAMGTVRVPADNLQVEFKSQLMLKAKPE